MTSKPITLTAAQVQAVLQGRLRQIRMVIKPQPEYHPYNYYFTWRDERFAPKYASKVLAPHVPYPVGTELWVRETWWDYGYLSPSVNEEGSDWDHAKWYGLSEGDAIKPLYDADNPEIPSSDGSGMRWRKRPYVHMPRWASRLTLLVTDNRAERLTEITEEDAFVVWRLGV
jgi:hypothetical protein